MKMIDAFVNDDGSGAGSVGDIDNDEREVDENR